MGTFLIQVLGTTRAWREGEAVDLGPAAQRAVLGLLVLACGRPLGRGEIVAGLWPDRRPPASAANVIQTYVKNLRRLLEPDRAPRAASMVLRQAGDGYALHLPPSTVDLLQFRHQVATATAARRRGQPDRAVDALEHALSLWHGPPLADIPALAVHPQVLALAEERLEALALYGEMMLEAGRAADGLSALEEAAAAQPLNEAWHALLIRAYSAAGRRSRAFETFHLVRRRLADELGVDPGLELVQAHSALLHHDLGAESGAAIPAQLPADVLHFVGRMPELSQLDGLDRRVVVVSGPPGVGKTALAVRWAHRIAHRFPDGQLYLNLRGFDPGGVVMERADAVRWFLDALGVPAAHIPSTVDAQSALYRSRIAGRRMLIVLDNARDAEQVRPLLPGTPGSLVLVTSRTQMGSLVASDCAHPLPLELLSPAAARELLAQRIGAGRVAAEPVAVSKILERCAGLPLALVITAARAAMNANLPLAVLAEQLRDDRDRLDALTTGDPGTDLRAVFSWSYRALAPETARLFRLLGMHPGPDIGVHATASLAALPFSAARARLAELVRANLVAEPTPGRYTMHDLVRSFASEMAQQVDQGRSRRAALRRVLDHYLHSAYAGDRLSNPARDGLILAPPAHGVVPEYPGDTKDALSWFTVERAVLIALVEQAAAGGWAQHAWQLAWALSTFLDLRGHWEDLIATQRTAIACARQVGELRGQADSHRLLARAYTRLRRNDEAHGELVRALALYQGIENQNGQSNTHLNLALLRERQGRYADALKHARQALELFRASGDGHGEARALNAVGWTHALLGDYARALNHCSDALARLRGLDDRVGEATVLDSIGYARHHLGEHEPALADFKQALDLYRDLGDRHLEAFVHVHLGETYEALGDVQAAMSSWHDALSILEHYDPPEAEKVHAKLGFIRDSVAVQSTLTR